MDWLEHRIPPPVVALTVAVANWLLARALPVWAFPFPGHTTLAVVLAVTGVLLGLAGILQFREARTTVHPEHPEKASALVTGGVYRFSRNPMYLGTLLVLAGWAVQLAHPAALVLLPCFVAFLDRFQIGPEERALRANFGDAFEAYARQVRRWL